MACAILTSLCAKLHEVVQTVKGNKGRCKEISERAQRLVPALERVSSSGDQEVSDIFCPHLLNELRKHCHVQTVSNHISRPFRRDHTEQLSISTTLFFIYFLTFYAHTQIYPDGSLPRRSASVWIDVCQERSLRRAAEYVGECHSVVLKVCGEELVDKSISRFSRRRQVWRNCGQVGGGVDWRAVRAPSRWYVRSACAIFFIVVVFLSSSSFISLLQSART